MKELKIGEEIRIRCVEGDIDDNFSRCEFCCFNNERAQLCDSAACCDYQREDGKNVHFEIVEDIHNIK